MSYIIRIFCREEITVTAPEIMEFVTEGGFLDQLKFELKQGVSSAAAWDRLVLRWDPKCQPIVFQHNVKDAAVHEEISRLMFILEVSKKTKAQQKVVDHLRQTAQMFSIEIMREDMTDTTWAMLDSVEAYLAKKCDGIVFTKDGGFYDRDLKHFYKL